MKSHLPTYLKTRFLILLFSFSFTQIAKPQIPTANSFSSQINYTGNYRYGVNQGYYPGWSAENTATIAAGSTTYNVKGVGVKSFRVPLYDDFLQQWGLTAEISKFQTYTSLGADDNTAFLGSPSAAHRDLNTYPGSPEQSKVFKNLFEPIWLDAAQTQINPDNYYAKYVYDVVNTYGQYIKFWEVVNEPDFTYSSAGWTGDMNPPIAGSWFDHNPTPDELVNLRAPIQSYIRMLRISWEVIKKLQPGDFVCLGGIGYKAFLDVILRNTDNPADGSVTSSYPNKGGAYFDVVSFHCYPMYNVSIGTRHSDQAVAVYVAVKNAMDNLTAKYGYNDSQYPKKQFICTETGVSRTMSGNSWGSNEGQRNYLIKASVLAQKNSIRQVYWYTLGDGPDPNLQFDRMGLYNYFGGSAPYSQTPSDQGKALKTTSDLLYGKVYDASRTLMLNLPSNTEGAAFRATDGNYTYVIWAKTSADLSEAANAIYSFPSTVVTSIIVKRREWDYSENNNTITVSKTNISLLSTPSFFSESFGSSGAGNKNPVALAGADQNMSFPVNTVILTGTGTDVDGTIMSYAWSQISGPSIAGILAPWQSSTSLVNLIQGVYQFEFKVTDNLGGVGKDTIQISVTATAGGSTSRIEAESYSTMSGVQAANTQDVGGGQAMGWIDNGDWMDYQVSAPSAGSYSVNFRVACPFTGARFQIKNSSGTVLATVDVPYTGGFENWQTVSASISLAGGSQTIRIQSVASAGFNFNWWEVAGASSTVTTRALTTDVSTISNSSTALNIYPNPVVNSFQLQINNDLTGALTIQVYDMQGALQKQFSLTKSDTGSVQYYLSIGELATANYIIKATMKGWSESKQISKQ